MALREDDSDLVPVAQYYFGRPTARYEYTGTLSCAHLPEIIRAGRGATHLAFELAPQRLVQRRGYGLELRHVSLLPQLERPFCLRAARKMPLAHACYHIPYRIPYAISYNMYRMLYRITCTVCYTV